MSLSNLVLIIGRATLHLSVLILGKHVTVTLYIQVLVVIRVTDITVRLCRIDSEVTLVADTRHRST